MRRYSKVLEPAKDNIIFKAPNPWTTAVLGLLKVRRCRLTL